MTDYYQYRITVEGQGQVSKILDNLPSEQWEYAVYVCEEHGRVAKLERRLITDKDILPLLEDATGFLLLPNGIVICPWDIIAGMNLIPAIKVKGSSAGSYKRAKGIFQLKEGETPEGAIREVRDA